MGITYNPTCTCDKCGKSMEIINGYITTVYPHFPTCGLVLCDECTTVLNNVMKNKYGKKGVTNSKAAILLDRY